MCQPSLFAAPLARAKARCGRFVEQNGRDVGIGFALGGCDFSAAVIRALAVQRAERHEGRRIVRVRRNVVDEKRPAPARERAQAIGRGQDERRRRDHERERGHALARREAIARRDEARQRQADGGEPAQERETEQNERPPSA